MQTFIWGEEFYTGLGLVDEQHHALVDLFNALSECLEASIEVGEAKVQLAFSELMDYTKYHFSAEADLMRQASLDPRYVSMHLALHGEFAMQVSAMWSAPTRACAVTACTASRPAPGALPCANS